jgi:hypothetical protein
MIILHGLIRHMMMSKPQDAPFSNSGGASSMDTYHWYDMAKLSNIFIWFIKKLNRWI